MPGPLDIVTLCQVTLDDPLAYTRFIRAGRVRPGDRWLHFQGAAEYIGRIAEGDAATLDAVARRRGIGGCLDCPHRTPNPDEPTALGYCGPMLESRINEDPATCGCPIEGLTACASRDCPLEDPRWRRCARVELTIRRESESRK